MSGHIRASFSVPRSAFLTDSVLLLVTVCDKLNWLPSTLLRYKYILGVLLEVRLHVVVLWLLYPDIPKDYLTVSNSPLRHG